MKLDEAYRRGTSAPTGDTVEEIKRLLGPALAVRFFAVFAGTSVTFPLTRRGTSYAQLVKVIGPEATERLCQRFGGEQPYIPRGTATERDKRNAEIAARIAVGEAWETVAHAYRTTVRHVRRVVKAEASKTAAANEPASSDPNSIHAGRASGRFGRA